jgi:hypothetical protein
MSNPVLFNTPFGHLPSAAAHQVAATVDPVPPPAPINPALEIALAALFLTIVISIHGTGLGQISKFFSTRFAGLTPRSPRWRATALSATAIGLIVSLHFCETLVWAGALLAFGMVDNYRDAYFYVLEAYTTLGEGPNYLPDGFRLVSPVIALTGLFTFGWSGSVLVYIVSQTGRLHAERSKAEDPEPATGQR